MDSNVKVVENGSINGEPSKIKVSKVPVPAVVVPFENKTNVPHHNPFDIDAVELRVGAKRGEFDSKKSTLAAESKNKFNDINLFGMETSSITPAESQLLATKVTATQSLFATKDVVNPENNNPFSIPLSTKPTLFSFKK